MDPISAITAALIAGATAAATGVASEAVTDAYRALKTVLVDVYKLASTALLEKKPSNPAYQQAVANELKDSPQIANDQVVLEKTQAVQLALREAPPEQQAAWGIDINELEAGGHIIAERIAGEVRGEKWKATGDARFSDIGQGRAPGKS
ncbi:hypothetical protein [Rhizobium leguminosarum]|uniref:hypothetical protein n=1 Tax=Rhizobium TaxID=379 RepID=UPI0013B9BB30|nr:hypothetical protein [Rhizobium leguminosarum]MBY5389623.1 hypothetical protein [Rhizobium leguminosarum]MBY5433029.1 hypothetical protein [Rhizobium leguminosarum]NEK44581.1 hypothetical protein [Rhizobium leguminosarum]